MYNRVFFQECFLYSSSTAAFSFKTTGLLIKADMKWQTPNKVLIRQSLKKTRSVSVRFITCYCGNRGCDGHRIREHKVNSGAENSPAAPAGIRTRNLSITSPALCQHTTMVCVCVLIRLTVKRCEITTSLPTFVVLISKAVKPLYITSFANCLRG